MRGGPDTARPPGRRRPGGGALAAVLVLVALNLRPAIASVPPVLPDIQRDLGLSGTAAGVLTALPVVCLGVFAPVAARLAARFGVGRVVAASLVVLGAGTLARAAGGAAWLFAATLVAGAGLAVGGALLPGIVKANFPEDRAATVTGLYTTGLAGGALLAAALTVPLRNLFGGSWAPALALWALPAVAALAVWRRVAAVVGADRPPGEPGPAAAGPAELPAAGPHPAELPAGGPHPAERTPGRQCGGLPWRSGLAWRVTLYTGLQSLLFYAALTWLSPLYQARGWSAERAGALLAVFSLAQLVATLGLPVLADRTGDRRPWIALSVGACTAGLLLVAVAPLAAPWPVAALIGFGVGGQFAMALTLLVDVAADPAASQRLSGMAFLVGYLLAAAGPAAVGGLYDATGGFTAAFLALTGIGVVTLALGVSVRRGPVV
ncbi:MAG TPA: MFS transporter [Actinomycetes bacterium]|nr:MFS transporter [Actinomycetes bacterium]